MSYNTVRCRPSQLQKALTGTEKKRSVVTVMVDVPVDNKANI